jgi:outer membrane protein assembly factor BamB
MTFRPRDMCATLCAAAVACAASASFAADWPQWGGSDHRSMVSRETNLPETFVAAKRDAKSGGIDLSGATNVKWAAKIGSNCFGSPVVAQGRVLLGTNFVDNDPRYQGNRATVLCLDEKTGKLLWQISINHPETPNLARGQSLGICASPTVDGKNVYVCGWTDILCLALDGQSDPRPGIADQAEYISGKGAKPIPQNAADGKILWRYEIPKELGVNMHDALAPAPLVVGEMLVFSTGNGVKQDHKTHETPDAPCLVAIDKNTGKLLAADDEKIGRTTFHGQWSSPTLATVAGKEQLVWGGGTGWVYGFDPKPAAAEAGKPAVFKRLWAYDMNRGNAKAYRAANGPSEVIATPICVDGKVYASTGQDWTHGHGKAHLTCIDASKTGEIAEPVWDYTDVDFCVGTPAVADGLVYAADLSGTLHCVDAATGKLVWKFAEAAPFHSSPTIADGKVFLADNRGRFYIFAHGKTMNKLAMVDLHGEAAGVAIAANGMLFVPGGRMLQAVGK